MEVRLPALYVGRPLLSGTFLVLISVREKYYAKNCPLFGLHFTHRFRNWVYFYYQKQSYLSMALHLIFNGFLKDVIAYQDYITSDGRMINE
jgi:hypothetical protein